MKEDELVGLALTKRWFELAVPTPTAKNFTTQFGVHLEEVAEGLDEVMGVTDEAESLVRQAVNALEALGNHMKNNAGSVIVTSPENFLDALCDQVVTATGTAHMVGYDIVGAMNEVNRSNFSKFDAEGNPIFNENGKIMKGPNYSVPVLTPFLG